jgi:hypothetical protein
MFGVSAGEELQIQVYEVPLKAPAGSNSKMQCFSFPCQPKEIKGDCLL